MISAAAVISFVSYCAVAAVCTYLFLRNMIRHYLKLGTNHSPRDESLGTKIVLLWRYNVIITLYGTAILFGYSVFISKLVSPLTLDAIAITAVLFGVINISVRLAAYGYAKRDEKIPIDDEMVEDLKGKLYSANFSFVVSLWFLLVLGVGLKMYTGTGLSADLFPTATVNEAILLSASTIGLMLVLSVLSEFLLWIWPLNVPNVLVDNLD